MTRHADRMRWLDVVGLLPVGLVVSGHLIGCDPGVEQRDAPPAALVELGVAPEVDAGGADDAAAAREGAAADEGLADGDPPGPADGAPSAALPGNRTLSGFCYPSTKTWSGPMGWLLAYPKYPYPGKFHRGSDIGEKVGSKIYALADGEVVRNGTSAPEVFQKHLWMRFKLADGTWFYAVYGHVSSALKKGMQVKACDALGQVEKLSWPHLHFGIHPAGVSTPWGMGKIPDGWDKDPATLPLNGWVMPWDYLQAHQPG